MRAVQMITERFAPPIFLRQKEIYFSLAVVKRLFQRVRDALAVLRPVGKAVGDDLQRFTVRWSFVELFQLAQALAAEQAMKTGALQARLYFFPGQRRGRKRKGQDDRRSFRQRRQFLEDRLGGVALHNAAAAAAMKH